MGRIERESAELAAGERPAVPASQGRIGLRLRDERRKQGLSLDDVAEALRIRKTYISAIENERFAELPGPAYALGFIGSYAQLLDFDRTAILARFREEYAGADSETELKFLVPLKDGRFPGRAVLVGSIVLAIAVYGGWFAYNNAGTDTPVASAAPPAKVVPAAAKPVKAKPPGEKPKPAKAAAAEPAPSKADVASLQRRASVMAALNRPGAGVKRKKAARATARHVRARKAKIAKLAAVGTPASGKARIILKAFQDTWVRIQLADGTKVMSRILKAGDSYAVFKNRGMVLTAGNAGGLRIIVDGRTLPSLGPKGAIRKGIRLNADELLASR